MEEIILENLWVVLIVASMDAPSLMRSINSGRFAHMVHGRSGWWHRWKEVGTHSVSSSHVKFWFRLYHHYSMSLHFKLTHGPTDFSQQSFTQALFHLAAHAEYIEPLREEMEAVLLEEGWTKQAMGKMNKLDSFLKESQRLSGLSAGIFFKLISSLHCSGWNNFILFFN